MDYKKNNEELVSAYAMTNDELTKKQLLEAFLTWNEVIIRSISRSLFRPWEDNLEDIFSNVKISSIETLQNPNAIEYFERGIFWTVVQNSAKKKIYEERGLGPSYANFKYRIANGEEAPDYVELNETLSSDRYVETDMINKEIREEFMRIFDTLPKREQLALLSRYSDVKDRYSSRTFTRIRKKARSRMISSMSYEKEDYENAFSEVN